MEKKPEQMHPDQWLKDLPATTQNEGFKQEEMLVCPKCQRLSPPNRLNCFYCSAELPISDKQLVKPALRKLENWEKGFNVVYLPTNTSPDEATIRTAADWLKLELEILQKILSANKSLPLARAESEREAEIISNHLKELNLECFVISDEKLKTEIVTRRLRGIEFFEDRALLILFNTNEVVSLSADDLRLIVSGGLSVRKIEAVEKHKSKDDNKLIDSSEMSTDDILIDLYTAEDSIGYRIESKGFDFSCLGEEKQLLVKDNIKKLFEKLQSFAPQAVVDRDYYHVRAELGGIWEVEQKRDSKGLQKKGFGKMTIESTTTVNNLSQFTKYSRLQWHLL